MGYWTTYAKFLGMAIVLVGIIAIVLSLVYPFDNGLLISIVFLAFGVAIYFVSAYLEIKAKLKNKKPLIHNP